MNINVLDSPLESLAFNYISHGSLAALIAIVTTVVSFWKINSKSLHPCLTTQDGASTLLEPSHPPSEMHVASASRITASVLERQSSTKVKFRAYYYLEEEEEREEEKEALKEILDEVVERCDRNKLEWWCEDRERIWDMGWYKGQDLTLLDGNVVRLWDGGRRRRATVEMVGGIGGANGVAVVV